MDRQFKLAIIFGDPVIIFDNDFVVARYAFKISFLTREDIFIYSLYLTIFFAIIFLFRAIWLALSLLILFFSMHRLSLLDSTRDVSELISLMSYGMMVICFPTGIVFFIALIFIGTVSDIIGVRIDSKYIMAIIIWLYFLSGGYIQWFVLSKRIINK